MDAATLKKHGWEPWLHEKVVNVKLQGFLDADEFVIPLAEQVEEIENIIDYCSFVIKEISARTWQMRNITDQKKFEAGVG